LSESRTPQIKTSGSWDFGEYDKTCTHVLQREFEAWLADLWY